MNLGECRARTDSRSDAVESKSGIHPFPSSSSAMIRPSGSLARAVIATTSCFDNEAAVSHGATILELLPRKEQSDLFWLHSKFFGQVFFGLENRYLVSVRHNRSPSRQTLDVQWTPRIRRLAIKTIIPRCFLKVEAVGGRLKTSSRPKKVKQTSYVKYNMSL